MSYFDLSQNVYNPDIEFKFLDDGSAQISLEDTVMITKN